MFLVTAGGLFALSLLSCQIRDHHFRTNEASVTGAWVEQAIPPFYVEPWNVRFALIEVAFIRRIRS